MVVQSDAGTVFAVADGRSEESEAARGSARWVAVEVGHEGGREEEAGGRGIVMMLEEQRRVEVMEISTLLPLLSLFPTSPASET